jgi:hypothetical protein
MRLWLHHDGRDLSEPIPPYEATVWYAEGDIMGRGFWIVRTSSVELDGRGFAKHSLSFCSEHNHAESNPYADTKIPLYTSREAAFTGFRTAIVAWAHERAAYTAKRLAEAGICSSALQSG